MYQFWNDFLYDKQTFAITIFALVSVSPLAILGLYWVADLIKDVLKNGKNFDSRNYERIEQEEMKTKKISKDEACLYGFHPQIKG